MYIPPRTEIHRRENSGGSSLVCEFLHFLSFEKYVFVMTGFSYITDSSGTSKVVKAHEVIFNNAGIDYIVLYPLNPKGIYTNCYGVIINGNHIGDFTDKEILWNLKILQDKGIKSVGVLVHHIIYCNLLNVIEILEVFKNATIVFYLHDFYSYCGTPQMLRNDKDFCGHQKVDCKGCKYEKVKEKHSVLMAEFFKKFDKQLIFVAPAEFTKDIYINLQPQFKNRVDVIQHLVKVGNYLENREQIEKTRSLKIAYVGAQNYEKGWEFFKELVTQAIEQKCNYIFYSFSSSKEEVSGIKRINVQIHLQGKNAMINALRKENIDVVIFPQFLGETYSYTLYEALAANCYILTTSKSGNIARVVKDEKIGMVFDTYEEMKSFFLGEELLRKTINDWRKFYAGGALEYEDNKEILKYFSGSYEIVGNFQKESLHRILFKKLLQVAYWLKVRSL